MWKVNNRNKKQRISTKLTISYIILNLLLISSVCAFFYHYNKKSVYQDGINNLVQATDSMVSQTDNRLTSMEQVAVDVLIHINFLDSWENFTATHSSVSRAEVGSVLNDVYKSKPDIRSVAVYYEDGNYVCTGNSNVTIKAVQQRVDDLKIQNRFDQFKSRIFLGPHNDFWNPASKEIVISEIKPIKNRNKEIIGFIEVQQNSMYLNKACAVFWNGKRINVLIFYDDINKAFYKNTDCSLTKNEISNLEKETHQYTKVLEDKNYIIATICSNYYAYRGIAILPKTELYNSLKGLLIWIMFAALFLSSTMIIYVILLTHKIMHPINTFVDKMKKIDLMNLDKPQLTEYQDYETEVLGRSFDNMTTRFQNTLEREKKLESVQIKTLFNILQNEISPHFLYNTLGSIANMCEAGENESAADACYNLTDIIRYASDYKTKEVSLKEELEQLKAYLAIMKSRYRQRLFYEIQQSNDIFYYQLPKLTIQPLVENAIKYSLLEQEQVRISINIINHNGCAEIHISDNGSGITEETKKKIDLKVNEFLEKNIVEDITQDIQIGGMGLSGTLIRLTIFFGSSFYYEIHVNKEGGTTISLYINLYQEEREKDV